jgi:hypothetical protein
MERMNRKAAGNRLTLIRKSIVISGEEKLELDRLTEVHERAEVASKEADAALRAASDAYQLSITE